MRRAGLAHFSVSHVGSTRRGSRLRVALATAGLPAGARPRCSGCWPTPSTAECSCTTGRGTHARALRREFNRAPEVSEHDREHLRLVDDETWFACNPPPRQQLRSGDQTSAGGAAALWGLRLQAFAQVPQGRRWGVLHTPPASTPSVREPRKAGWATPRWAPRRPRCEPRFKSSSLRPSWRRSRPACGHAWKPRQEPTRSRPKSVCGCSRASSKSCYNSQQTRVSGSRSIEASLAEVTTEVKQASPATRASCETSSWWLLRLLARQPACSRMRVEGAAHLSSRVQQTPGVRQANWR